MLPILAVCVEEKTYHVKEKLQDIILKFSYALFKLFRRKTSFGDPSLNLNYTKARQSPTCKRQKVKNAARSLFESPLSLDEARESRNQIIVRCEEEMQYP